MSVEHYLSLPWTYRVETLSQEAEIIFVVQVNELPGLSVRQASLSEAMTTLRQLMTDTIASMVEQGITIPEPINQSKCKGQISYRTSSTRHWAVAKEARRRGVSLSRLIDECIDSSLCETRE